MEQKGAAGNALGLWDLWFQGFVICHEKAQGPSLLFRTLCPFTRQKTARERDPKALARYTGLRDDDSFVCDKIPANARLFLSAPALLVSVAT